MYKLNLKTMKYKNNIAKFLSVLFILFMVSCIEEDPITSTITNFPTFEYEDMVVIEVGSSYTPVAKAFEGDTEIDINTSGSVDTNTVGIYEYTFSATNSDGYDGNVVQTVVVHNPNIVGTDVSGEIEDVNRPTRDGVISLVEGTTSIFYASDFGFSGTFPVYFQMDGDVISEIPQNYINGVSSVDLTYDPVQKIFTTLINPQGFGYTFQYK